MSRLFLLAALLVMPVSVSSDDGLPWQDARRFVEALEISRAEYVNPIDTALIDYAVRWMASGHARHAEQ